MEQAMSQGQPDGPRPEAELDAAAQARRQQDRELTMSERLAQVHELCLQLTAISGAAKRK